MAHRRVDAGAESSLQRGLYSIYRRYGWMDANDSDGPGFLTAAPPEIDKETCDGCHCSANRRRKSGAPHISRKRDTVMSAEKQVQSPSLEARSPFELRVNLAAGYSE